MLILLNFILVPTVIGVRNGKEQNLLMETMSLKPPRRKLALQIMAQRCPQSGPIMRFGVNMELDAPSLCQEMMVLQMNLSKGRTTRISFHHQQRSG
jgi:hypothetical protein